VLYRPNVIRWWTALVADAVLLALLMFIYSWRTFASSIFSSFHEWAYAIARRPSSVCPSVRLSVNFYTQVATSTTNMTGSPPNLHTMVPTWTCIQGVLKVKVKRKGLMIRTLLWCHEMFAIQYLLTFCLYMHWLYEAPLHSPSSISVRQLDALSTSWNELLRHWRSGFIYTQRKMWSLRRYNQSISQTEIAK